jgi:TetR/AcrR family transcriptional regulator
MNSKERILEAAIELFAEKGKHGTRIEEVAARAGINKAMVYYYYTSKDNLYKEVLKSILQSIYTNIYGALEKTPQDNDPISKVKSFLAAHFEAFSNQKIYTKIILDVHANEPDEFKKVFESVIKNWEKNIPQEMMKIFEQGIAQKIFRDINYKHVMISIFGMNLIYYFGKSIAQALLQLEVDDEQMFLKEREESNIDLLLNGILTK